MIAGLRTPWRALAFIFAFNGALYGAWAARIPAVAERYDLGPAMLGLQLLFLAAGAIVAFPIAGRFVDRLGAVTVTRAAAWLYFPILVVVPLSPGFWTLAGVLFLFGAVHGVMDVAMNAWASEVEKASKRPIMSSFHAMWSLGTALGVASGYLAIKQDMSIFAHFVVFGAVAAAVTLPMIAIPWKSEIQDTSEAAPVFAFPKGLLALVGIAAMCTTLGEGAMADWSAIFLIEAAGVDEAKAALGFFFYSIAMVATRLAGDRIVARFGPVTVAQASGVSVAIGALLAVFVGTFTVSIIGFVFMAFGYALIFPLAMSRAANDPHQRPGVAIASVATFAYGGTLIGPPLIGFVAAATSVQFSFILLAGLALILFSLARVLASPRP